MPLTSMATTSSTSPGVVFLSEPCVNETPTNLTCKKIVVGK